MKYGNKWLISGIIILVATAFTIGQLSFTSAQNSLVASAGPDLTVPGPNPVMVTFDGNANVTDYTCEWRNQWGLLRASDCDTTFEVSFGKNPKIGTKRSFTLTVTDLNGRTAKDKLTLTLGATNPGAAPDGGDPAAGQVFVGELTQFEYWGWGGPSQNIMTGRLSPSGDWYISSSGAGDDAYDYFASVQCYQGQHFEVLDVENVKIKEGCSGPGNQAFMVVLISGGGGWTIRSETTGEKLALLTPPSKQLEFQLVR